MAKDPVLSGLLQFNQTVTSFRGNKYIVDLLWPEGRVVVEVDGYQFHSNRYAFSADRFRDYDLAISGYTVLRLPHDEVMDDVHLAIEKIRDVINFREKSVVKQ